MKTLGLSMLGYLSTGSPLPWATCWLITRTDGVKVGLTTWSSTLVIGGDSYYATPGASRMAVETAVGLGVDNSEVVTLLTSPVTYGMSEDEVRAGLYQNATVECFLVHATDLSAGKVPLLGQVVGNITLGKGVATLELRGSRQKLNRAFMPVVSLTCRAVLGDAQCGVDLTHGFTESLTVGATFAPSRVLFDTTSAQADGYYTYGVVHWTSGSNVGLRRTVRLYQTGGGGAKAATLYLPMPFDIAVGDAFDISKGCDKTIATCGGVFSNAANFRGEPYVPGIDALNETSSGYPV